MAATAVMTVVVVVVVVEGSLVFVTLRYSFFSGFSLLSSNKTYDDLVVYSISSFCVLLLFLFTCTSLCYS